MSERAYLIARVSKGVQIRDTGIVPAGPVRESPKDRLRRKRANNVRNSAALAGGGATAFGAAGLMHMQGERKMWDAATAPAHMFKDTAWDLGEKQVRRAGVLGRTGKLAMLGAVPFGAAAGVRHAQLKRAQRG